MLESVGLELWHGALLAGLFGLLIGSFLNVCIYRWPRDLSVVQPRSHCPECETPIAWYDNVPLLSFVLLRGQCRQCKVKIPWRYPLMELGTGLLFAAAVLRLGWNLDAAKLCAFAGMMLALVVMDLETRILADEFTLGGAAAGLMVSLFVPMPRFLAHFFLPAEWKESYLSLAESLIGGFLPALVLEGIARLYLLIRGRDGLGFGDVKMIVLVGSFYGLQGSLQTLILGSLAGSLIGMLFIAITKKDASTYELPFGSFLGIAALVPPFLLPEVTGRLVVPW